MSTFKFNKKKTKRIKRNIISHSRTTKKLIPFIICSIFTFTGVAIWVQVRTGIELSPTLITCFYAFCTGELWMLASIKKTKVKTGQKVNDYQNMIVTKEDDDETPVG